MTWPCLTSTLVRCALCARAIVSTLGDQQNEEKNAHIHEKEKYEHSDDDIHEAK